MAKTIRPRQRQRHERFIRVLEQPTAETAGLLLINQDGEAQAYWFAPIPCAIGGRAFAVRKFRAAESYHVRLNGPDSSCDCPAGTYHAFCKHREGLEALDRANRLPYRSAGDLAANDPIAHARHEASIGAAFTSDPSDYSPAGSDSAA